LRERSWPPTPPIIGGAPGGGGGAERPLRRVAELRAPFWIAHRGMANVYPENTLEAYRGTVALGVAALESDCWLTRDMLEQATTTSVVRPGQGLEDKLGYLPEDGSYRSSCCNLPRRAVGSMHRWRRTVVFG
jgi:Glycerophosphoryl diester phosphodiesterase family